MTDPKYKTDDDGIVDLNFTYDLENTAKWINVKDFNRVALQLPDDLLTDSYKICKRLENLTKKKIYISVDTTYSNCCIDEISAKHVNADAIIHYGHACLSPCNSNVYYVHPKSSLNIPAAIKSLSSLIQSDSKIAIFYHTSFDHLSDKIMDAFFEAYPNILIAKLNKQTTTTSSMFGRHVLNSSKIIQNIEKFQDYQLVYIGNDDQTLFNIFITKKFNETFVLDTTKYELKNYSQSTWMMRRRYIIEKCKDADNIGILVCTLSIANFTSIIKRLRSLIKLNGKRSYVLTLGKPNIAKLSNVYEIDIFVLIACPENDLYGCRDFMKPIAYPYELELALNRLRDPYSTNYVTDFNNLLEDGDAYCDLSDNTTDNPDISLITGKARGIDGLNIDSDDDQDSDNNDQRLDIVKKEEWALSKLGINDALTNRSWKGLEQKLGETKIEKAQEGRRGIASGYDKEPN